MYLIGGVMVSMLTWSVVDHGFEPQSNQTNDYKIDICYFSAKYIALRSNWLGIWIMCEYSNMSTQ